MPFLSKDVLRQARGKTIPIKPHPILMDGPLPLGVRIAYLQGCIFATLMDDSKVSGVEKAKLIEIARSLQLGEGDLEDGIVDVSSAEESTRPAIFSEIINQVKGELCAKWFAIDFERLLAIGGNISEDGKGLLSFTVKMLFKRDDWRLDIWNTESGDCSFEDFKRYVFAAEDGDRYAQLIVARCYHDGIVVGKDNGKALFWFEKSAKQGCAAAQMEIARLYKLGQGVEANDVVAEDWLRKAIDNGHPEAKKELDQLLADRQLVLNNREQQRKAQERHAKKQAEAYKAKLMCQFEVAFADKKKELRAEVWSYGAGCAGVAMVIEWWWLSWWQLMIFGWIGVIIAFVGGCIWGWNSVEEKIASYRATRMAEIKEATRRKYEEALR